MPQFDVHRLAKGSGFVVDCQSDLLDPIDSRFVVPLVPLSQAPPPVRRLNPVFVLDGEQYVLVTQAAAAIRRSDLGAVVGSLKDRRLEVTGALDVLVAGI
jgi:toxin CcdB